MADVDLSRVRELAESAERRAKEIGMARELVLASKGDALEIAKQSHSLLNDFFYWSGKATSYRGVVAMAELQTVVEDELDAEPTCP